MHPYRTLLQEPPPSVDVETERGLRLAIWVTTTAGIVQVASALPRAAPVSWQTAFGGACFVAGLVWLVRHRGH
jgi:hypothetical protein